MGKEKKSIKLRVIFMGTSQFADQILSSMIEAGLNVISVYTKPDKKSGRDREMKKSAAKLLAEKNNIPVFQPEKLNEESIQEISSQKPDLIVVAAYGKIIPKAILDIPGFGVINIHPSLLPKFRGPSPIQNAILSGETKTGTTIMLMDEGVDTGDILKQAELEIGKDETNQELSIRLADLSGKLLLEVLPLWIERKIEPAKQDNSQATLCQLIEREDGKIIWANEAESIYNLYRALIPWPGTFTFWEINGTFKRIKLNKINFSREKISEKHHIGEVFQIEGKVAVQAMLGVIFLEEVQLEGKENIKIEDFVNGYKDFVGSILK